MAVAAAPVALSMDTPGGSEYYTHNIVIRSRHSAVASRSAVVRLAVGYNIVVLIIILYECFIFTLLVFLPLSDTVSWSRFVLRTLQYLYTYYNTRRKKRQ